MAAAGANVAKHGNRAASSNSGSADVLQACGVNISLDTKIIAQCIDTIGIGFLYAPQYHPSMKYCALPRKELGIRTLFNLLGPLTNPADVKLHVIGVYDKALLTTFAQVLRDLGSHRALIVHGADGLDEISIAGET